MKDDSKLNILGIPVNMVSLAEAEDLACAMIEKEKKPGEPCGLIATPNSEIIINASKDEKFAAILTKADLVIPDGIGIVYASRILGQPLSERVTGFDLLGRIIARLSQGEKSIFLLGSKPGEESEIGIAELAAQKMKERYPNLQIAGTHHGFFGANDEEEIVKKINDSRADFLCVAMGSPRQELFVYRNRNALYPKVAIGVGGSLDVWAGVLKRSPVFFQKNGLEWFYRLVQEPSRYKRMTALPLFMIKVLFSRRGSKS